MQQADICLVLEGTYPYYYGGVGNWTHDLLQQFSHKTFHLVCIVPYDATLEHKYEIPKNVLNVTTISLQRLETKKTAVISQKTAEQFATLFSEWLRTNSLETFSKLFDFIKKHPSLLNHNALFTKNSGWHILHQLYQEWLPNEGAFLDFYWTWRIAVSSLLSLFTVDVPPAKSYHALSTGYAGLFMARCAAEKQQQGLLTEHGIYTNERNIEISSAEWLQDGKSLNLATVFNPQNEKTLKKFLELFFKAAAATAYQSSYKIITMFRENTPMQIADGASPEKLEIIPNTINVADFATIKKRKNAKKIIALVGRVVAIKDVKSYIRAIYLLKQTNPDIKALVIGDADIDVKYTTECHELAESLGVTDVLEFLPRQPIKKILEQVDIMVLSSLSESQPLVILEAGAAKIPFVATNVGFCKDMIQGTAEETPRLGSGGVVCPLASPTKMAQGLAKLLDDPVFYESCANALYQRISTYYPQSRQQTAYEKIYAHLAAQGKQ